MGTILTVGQWGIDGGDNGERERGGGVLPHVYLPNNAILLPNNAILLPNNAILCQIDSVL
jgi:hypothetical protein